MTDANINLKSSHYRTARGEIRFITELYCQELNKHCEIKGSDPSVMERKTLMKIQEWNQVWEKQQEKERLADERRAQKQATVDAKQAKLQEASDRTNEAQQAIFALKTILQATLGIDDTIDWDSLKLPAVYNTAAPAKCPPKEPMSIPIPEKPKRTDAKYTPQIGIFEKLFPFLKARRIRECDSLFMEAHARWEIDARRLHESNTQARDDFNNQQKQYESDYQDTYDEWLRSKQEFLEEVSRQNAKIELRKQAYLTCNPSAIFDYLEMVLGNSEYPEMFPKSFELDYSPDTKILVVDYELPAPNILPTLIDVRYIASRNEFSEKHLNRKALDDIYDSIVYQVCLRTIHELFESDQVDALSAIVFNGLVVSTDPSTGKETTSCIISVQATKAEFEEINLANIDPKACFKRLKGVGSSKLHLITPIAPIIRIEREDRRFVDSYSVASGISDDTNLAAMDWEDFEHLIRELFEKEFSSSGGEVRVTQASRDGGVDAVIFDPDPIRGGKIVVQAKRYTNTVGVSAVRDLYGTLVNEGANKGILVCTSDYGPDAYEFARAKPLTLLNGGNLLHLLAKHGHSAKIDIKEAKALQSGNI